MSPHQQYVNFVSEKVAPEHKFHNILRMKSYLTDDWDGQLQAHSQKIEAAAIEITLGPGKARFSVPENTSNSILAGNWLQEPCGSKICYTNIRFRRARPR